MGYGFDTSGQFIDWGTRSEFVTPLDMSIGFWIKLTSTAIQNFFDHWVSGLNVGLNPVMCRTILDTGHGYGIQCEHLNGGSFRFGVSCAPGLINPAYTWNIGQWRYFGFSRNASARTYFSYFGSAAALIDCQIGTYSPTDGPCNNGTAIPPSAQFFAGALSTLPAYVLGPLSFWSRVLSKSEHHALAQCTLPGNTSGLLLWTKMEAGAADISPHAWPNTFHGSPLPVFEPDNGCVSFATGNDYSFHVA